MKKNESGYLNAYTEDMAQIAHAFQSIAVKNGFTLQDTLMNEVNNAQVYKTQYKLGERGKFLLSGGHVKNLPIEIKDSEGRNLCMDFLKIENVGRRKKVTVIELKTSGNLDVTKNRGEKLHMEMICDCLRRENTFKGYDISYRMVVPFCTENDEKKLQMHFSKNALALGNAAFMEFGVEKNSILSVMNQKKEMNDQEVLKQILPTLQKLKNDGVIDI